jgi:2-dehydro-3-deoxyphosphogluconate aldolase / (4S)-4-hydroxy-2-oxoglutarate aldolase
MIAASDVHAAIARARLLPVLVIDDANQIVAIADALTDGGVPVVEITCRTPAALDAIRRLRTERPDTLVGAGTVLTTAQLGAVLDAGAQFVVSPALNPDVVRACQARGVAVYPGVATPTEIDAAMRLDLRVLKLFPAEVVGGAALIDAVGAVFPDVRFIPTGGLRREHLARYAATERVLACGGGWMVRPEWIRAGQFDRVRTEVIASLAELSARSSQ